MRPWESVPATLPKGAGAAGGRDTKRATRAGTREGERWGRDLGVWRRQRSVNHSPSTSFSSGPSARGNLCPATPERGRGGGRAGGTGRRRDRNVRGGLRDLTGS